MRFDVIVTSLHARPEAVRAMAARLSDAERQRAHRFAFDRERRRFIAARSRLRALLAARLGAPAQSIELECGPHGKPVLGRRFADSNWRFNLSHCGDLAVYVFSRGREVGVDLEAVRALPEADEIAARFFSRHENEAYAALEPSARRLGFFNCWTRKEAFVKALGGGLCMPLDDFDVSLAPGEPARLLRVGNIPGGECGWRLRSFSPVRGYVAALATQNS